MSSIDDRIVQMSFDNKLFERKISQTISSMEKLNTTLSSLTNTKGLEGLANSTKNFDVSGMSAGIEGVSKKFLALSTVAITVLSEITRRAFDAGTRIVKSLSLDPILGGFQEYETNMKSIQTILANTKADGTNLGQVNDALDELNSYADLTIYNFAEMARNIGTFTAAGVELDTSVQSIKGIANLAAISGSSSQQASTAMYQLSQAISSGTLRLQDWNSVVNAGMGGEVFQRALFESGKALQTIEGVPIDQTFDEWTAAGNTFRGSLESQWLTSEVLTTTLQGFTGEMTAAELAAKGFTQEQIATIQEMGQVGVEAATKVRTLTQLWDTAQEAVGSGWSQTFRIVLGDFEEATELFTGISEVISGMVENSANSRNELLQGWSNLGGRTQLIESLGEAFGHLQRVLREISKAFRDVFPKKTSSDLMRLTIQFRDFVDRAKPSLKTLSQIKRIFTGFFSAIKIGATILKEGAKFVGAFFAALTGAGEGEFLGKLANIGDFFTNLRESLVDGGGITNFFENLTSYVEPAIEKIHELKDAFVEFIAGLTGGGGVQGALEGAGEGLGGFLEKLRERFAPLIELKDRFMDAFGKVFEVGGKIFDFIKDFVADVFSALGDAFFNAEYDDTLDVINTGILGVLAGAFAKLAAGGFDIGGGFFEAATESLEELTGVLSAMQADLKANALLKIAGAVGILTLSVMLLATIDSAALTKALTAMTIGFGQLVGALTLLTKLQIGPTGGLSIMALGAALIFMAGAMLLLAVSAKIFATMSWEEIAKGLVAITGLLVVLVGAAFALDKMSGSLVRAGVGLAAIGFGMLILAAAMKIFATMNWEEIGKGLVGVGAGLGLIVAAINLIPASAAVKAVGILLVAAALNLIATSMKIFATMSWEEIGKGLVGIAGGLLLIAGAMQLMPGNIMFTAIGVAIVAGALNLVALAVVKMAELGWMEIARGLTALAGSLLIMGIALKFMSGNILGAVALTVAAGGVYILAKALGSLAKLSIGQVAASLITLALGLTILGTAGYLLAPIIPAFIGLGLALTLAGAGMFLFGLGVGSVVNAIEAIVRLGETAVGAIVLILEGIIGLIPKLAGAVGEALKVLVGKLVEAIPDIVEAAKLWFGGILDAGIELMPKVAEFIIELVKTILTVIEESTPDVVEAGFSILLSFLQGLRDNIGEIATTVADIITEFLDALAEKVPEIIDSVFNLIVAVWEGVAAKLVDIAEWMLPYGKDLLNGMLEGVKEGVVAVKDWFLELPGNILEWIGDLASLLWNNGDDLLVGLLAGIVAGAVAVTDWFSSLPGKVLGWIGDVTSALLQKGKDFLAGLWDGILAKMPLIREWFRDLPEKVKNWIGSLFTTLGSKGKNLIIGLYNGVISFVNEKLIPWFTGLPGKIRGWIGDAAEILVTVGRNIVIGLWNGLVQKTQWIKDKVGGWISSVIPGPIKSVLNMNSPSKLMAEYGGFVAEGLALGIETNTKMVERASSNAAMAVVDGFTPDVDKLEKSMAKLYDIITNEVDVDTDIRITPVLEMDQFRRDAREISALAGKRAYAAASSIASTRVGGEALGESSGGTEIRFEQTINSPKALSTSDIYRQTRNQITVAKEELAIQ